MSEATLEKSRTGSPVEAAIAWAMPRRDVLVVASIMAVAFVMRLWNLGDMALHHDESLHATYSWYLYNGDGYRHNPMMHGPFLFHTGATIYFLFGDTDMTARLLPAVFGTLLVGMPFLLRRQIGMPAVIIAAVLLAFSPTLLYYARFFRNDIYIAVWTLGLVICTWRYLDEGKNGWLYGLAALLALSFATKEVSFITVAIMLVFVDLMLAVELGRRRAGEAITDGRIALRTALIAPVAWLIAALWPLLGKDQRESFGRERLPPIGDIMVLLGILSLPQFAAGIQVLPFVTNYGYNAPEETTLRAGTVAALLVASAYIGLIWRPRVFVIAAACFFVPYVLLYTTFFTNIDGFFSGIWGSLDYWLDQHGERRGDQPLYYYALLTPLYEFFPLVVGFATAAWLALRGDSLRRWLLFWLLWIFVGLSVAGEKMPWLEVHIALPLVLVAALGLAKAIDVLHLRGSHWLTVSLLAAVTAAAVVLVLEAGGALNFLGYLLLAAALGYAASSLRRDRSDDPGVSVRGALASSELLVTAGVLAGLAIIVGLLSFAGAVEAILAGWLLLLIPVAAICYAVGGLMVANKTFGRAVFAVGVAALMTLTVRASLTVTYTNADTPVELMVYTQTSPDIPQLRDRIDSLAERSDLGQNLPIVVDTADSFAWPWAWYLRDYRNVRFTAIGEDFQAPPGTVLLLSRGNAGRIDASQFTQSPYRHRWWFLETYRGLSFQEATDVVLSSQRRGALVDFFFHRRPVETGTGSVDGVAFFPLDLSAFDHVPGPEAPANQPTVMADGRIVLGAAARNPGGAIRGEFWQPADIFVDGGGNIWVADGRNHRIQKFDASGNFLESFGRSGGSPGSFNEPWGVAVDNDGFVYVADTWNHRIQKFSPEGRFVATWGSPGVSDSDPLTLFGPRDIAMDAEGNLWVTDTGNQRVLRFSPDGDPLDTGGVAPGGGLAYAEPVGLAFDREGGLLVVDTWNGRILRFDAGRRLVDEIEVGWTSREVLAKPYVAVLTDGRILVAVPERGELLLLSSEGERLGAWQPLAGSMPVGVAAMPDGGFVFGDVQRNELQIVPARLIDGFFQ